jgi:lysyl-tRNA synthetase class 2
MVEHEDSRALREHKLQQLAALGLPYLPNRYPSTRPSAEVVRDFEALDGSRVRVAGRLMRVRLMGKAAFAHIQDRAGQIQLYFKLDVLGQEKFDYFKLLDVGDIVGAEGTVFKTRTGEVSVNVEDLVLLAKSYLPLPDKFHGIANVETRYRQRYLDLISNEEARKIFAIRSETLRAVRQYLNDREFVEVETPVLQALYGGAAANPFTTHYASLDSTVYLRIATELYLKRLIVGGMERVYEIGKDFRNEGYSWKHSPEFTMLELYQAYADYHDIMALTEDMVSEVAQKVLRTATVTFNGHEIDLTPPWTRVTIREAVRDHAGIDLTTCRTVEDLTAAALERGLELQPNAPRGEVIEEIVSELVEPNLIQPTFLMDYPIDFPGSLLAKRKAGEPDIAERFEIYAGGFELGNAFTELNEPGDQLVRMQELARESGGESSVVDWDFVRALEHGMPPTGGVGIGLDRLVMLLAGIHGIRETILFPLLRQREESNA